MSTHQNAHTYREATRALAEGDMTQFMSFIDEDVAWWELGSPEPIEGKTALAQLLRLSHGSVEVNLHDVLANDEHLVALVHSVASLADGDVGFSYAEVLHFHESRIVKRQIFPADVALAQRIIAENR